MPEGCTQPSKPGSGEELKIDLGWQEGLSQRFHRLSQTALDKLIASLLAVKYQRGKQAPLDASSSVIQRLCSASRCARNRDRCQRGHPSWIVRIWSSGALARQANELVRRYVPLFSPALLIFRKLPTCTAPAPLVTPRVRRAVALEPCCTRSSCKLSHAVKHQ